MLSKSNIKFIRQLHQKKYRNEHKLFIAEGEKIVGELLTSSFNIHSLYGTNEWVEENQLNDNRFPIAIVTEKELAEISLQETPNKVMALIFQPGPEAEVLFEPDKNYLLLDAVRDPGNLGTILRIADWFGITKLVCSLDCVEIYNPKVVQSSMGSIFRVPFVAGSLTDFLKENTDKAKLLVYGAMLDGKRLYDVKFDKGTILIIGNESNGLSESVKQWINQSITIPTFNTTGSRPESLNAAVATAVCCSEICRQQQ